MAKMTVAQAVVEILRQEQVGFVAGIPGSGVMDYMDALYHQSDVRFILVRHEQVAAHMALGYAEACGRPAVTLVSRSPGASNTVIGVASAFIEGHWLQVKDFDDLSRPLFGPESRTRKRDPKIARPLCQRAEALVPPLTAGSAARPLAKWRPN